jgi:hypothetical protein
MMVAQLWTEIQDRKKLQLLEALRPIAKRQKAHDLALVVNLEEASQLRSFGAFEAALEKICVQYANQGLPRMLQSKLYPHLNHLRSISDGLSTMAQTHIASAICWGGLLLVVQVSRRADDCHAPNGTTQINGR